MATALHNEEAGAPHAEPGGGRPAGRRHRFGRLLPIGLPIVIFAAALVLPAFIFQTPPRTPGTGLGPAAWPRGVLALLACFALVWAIRDIWAADTPSRRPSLSLAREEGVYSWSKAGLGLLLVVAYGALLPLTGFAVATAGFVVLWCLAGGLRNIVTIAAVALGGTVALLWMFMGIALMPLSRGAGVFNDISVALLRFLGIY